MRKLMVAVCFALLLSGNAWAADTHGIAANVLSKTGLSWDGQNLPEYPSGKPEITIIRIKIPAGSELPVHKHSVINAGVLLSGELTVVTEDNKVLRLKAGESIVEVVNIWHYGKNEGSTPAEIVVFYAGTPGTAITAYKPGSVRSSPSQGGH